MVYGLEFTLEEVTEKNKRVNIKINQDTNQVLDNMQAFVMNYNALMTEVDNMTRYDADEDKVGLFLGENTINSVRSSINNILRQVGPNGESIANAGVTFSRDGQMEFDSFAFEKSLLDDPDSMQVLLQGKKETKNGKDLQEDGLFYKLYEVMDDLVNSADGSIINFEKSLETQLKRTKDEKKTAIKRLDNRYETMQNQFAAAGSAIGKLQNGFESVNMQIKQAQSSK
jgi:flagellar hook-associated protein 2